MNERKLNFSSKFGYGLGCIVFATKDVAFNTFLLFYYTQVLALSGTLAGLALLIGLCADAVSDPVMGSISDNFQSKYGRRHPFMLLSSIPLAVTFIALFAPPSGLGQTGLFIWMMIFVILLRTFLTVFQVPYLALGAEMTGDYVERTTISTYRTTFAWVGGVTVAIISYLTFFAKTEKYPMGQMNIEGYPLFGIFCAAVVIVMILSTVTLTRKEIPFLPEISGKPKKFNFLRLYLELKMALENHSFRTIFIASLFFGALKGTLLTIYLHINTYFWGLTSEKIAVLSTAIILASIIAFILMKKLRNFDKRKVLNVVSVMALFNSTLIILRLFDILPPNGDPLLFKFIYIQSLYIITLLILLLILIGSIIADTVDEGELKTGVRQEGMYFAFLTFNSKAVTGLGSLFAGFIIDFVNLPAKAVPGAVDPAIVWNLGFITGPIIGVLWLIPFFIILRLRISREQMLEIRKELNKRQKLEKN